MIHPHHPQLMHGNAILSYSNVPTNSINHTSAQRNLIDGKNSCESDLEAPTSLFLRVLGRNTAWSTGCIICHMMEIISGSLFLFLLRWFQRTENVFCRLLIGFHCHCLISFLEKMLFRNKEITQYFHFHQCQLIEFHAELDVAKSAKSSNAKLSKAGVARIHTSAIVRICLLLCRGVTPL